MAVLLVGCAVVEPPPGGPEDLTPPHLAASTPDSGATGLGPLTRLDFTFSEKMDRQAAVQWLRFFPDQSIRKTSWKGATRAEITLEEPMPADTVVVVEIAAGMKDAHRVANKSGRRFPIATGDSIPTGLLTGVLIMADSAVTNGVVELFALPPDTLKYFEQPLLRRAVTDRTGAWSLEWLPVPGGPWLVRAFADANGDLRPGEKEAQRLLPDTLAITVASSSAVAGVLTLYPADAPGRLRLGAFAPWNEGVPTLAWSMKVGDADTGWVPVATDKGNFATLDPAGQTVLAEVDPGPNRLVLFADVDGDSLFSGLPVAALDTALADTVTHVLEPWFLVEGAAVEPGLESALDLPPTAWTLTPWTPPPAAPGDTLLTAPGDTTAAPPSEEADE